MTARKGLAFFRFFLNYVRSIWDPHEITTHENSRSRPGGVDSRFFPCCLVKKWRITDPKMICAKNQEVNFLALKCKTAPVPTISTGACAKFRIYLQRLWQQNESWYVGCFSQLSILRFDSCFIKNLIRHSENGKSTFHGMKRKSASMAFLAIPRATRVSDMALFRQTMPWSWSNLAHFT
jgi:hypothetical protein